jgi:nitrous oxidase accessory protein NosD
MLPKLVVAEYPTYSYFQNASREHQYAREREQIIDLSYNGNVWSENEFITYNSKGIGNPMVHPKGANVNLFV